MLAIATSSEMEWQVWEQFPFGYQVQNRDHTAKRLLVFVAILQCSTENDTVKINALIRKEHPFGIFFLSCKET